MDGLSNRLVVEGREVMIRQLPTAESRERLEARLRQIGAILRPAKAITNGTARIGAALAGMFAGFMNARPANAEQTTAAYIAELSSLPAWAVERACRAVSTGEVSGLSPDFPPSAARLHQVASTHTEKFLIEQASIRAILTAKLLYQPSEDERERIRDGFDDLSTRLKKSDPSDADRKARIDAQTLATNENHVRRARELAGLPPPEPGALLVSPSLLKTLHQPDNFEV